MGMMSPSEKKDLRGRLAVAMLKKNLLGSDALFGLSLEMKQGTLSKIYKDAAETLQRIEEDERISKS